MTNAERHVAAFQEAYPALPVTFPQLQARILAVWADGDCLWADVEWWNAQGPAHFERWQYPSPEIWVPDAAGDVPRTKADLDENDNEVEVVVMGRIDAAGLAQLRAEAFARQLDDWRGRA